MINEHNESAAADNSSISISNLNQKEKESRMKSIHHFEVIIADPITTFIDKTRARLELALLRGDDNRNEKSRIKKEIEAIKGAAGVARTKDKLEQGILSNEEMHLREKAIRLHQEDLALEAKQRRVDAKRRVEEQRKRATDAQKLLSQLEEEAEDAIMRAKDAMKRANEAWVEAGREQKKAQELEAQLEKIQIMADDDLVSDETKDAIEAESQSVALTVSRIEERNNEDQMERSRVNASVDRSANLKEETTSSNRSSSEGYFTKYFKLSIKVEQLEKEKDEFDVRLKEKDAAIERLKSKDHLLDEKITLLNKLHEETITSLNKLHKKEIESLNGYVKETGQSQMFWKHQSKVLAGKLQMSRQRKSEQELEVVIMKDQLDIKLKEIHELKAEIEDLRQTKNEFEAQLSVVEEKQKANMLKLKADADALIEEKERALKALQIVQESHLKVLGYQEEEVSVLTDDILEYEKDLEEVKERERGGNGTSSEREDELTLLSDECRHWKKKSASLSLRLDILKDEVKAHKRENAKLKQSADNDRLFSRLLSNYKLEKKKTKDLKLNLRVAKKEAKERDARVRERDAKIRERDAIIDELTQRNLNAEAAPMDEDGQKSAAYWKYGK